MSESITHTAVVDDALRFVESFSGFSTPFKTAAKQQKDLARLGGITRHGDRHNPILLEKVREAFKEGRADDSDFAKLGFVIGWLSHRATDRQFKRIFRIRIYCQSHHKKDRNKTGKYYFFKNQSH